MDIRALPSLYVGEGLRLGMGEIFAEGAILRLKRWGFGCYTSPTSGTSTTNRIPLSTRSPSWTDTR